MISEPSLPEFQIDRTAHSAHSALRRSLAVAEQAQHCAVLWFGEIMRRGLFRELGYSSMAGYATEELGFSRGKANDFLRLAGKLEELPRLKESVARGEVGYTKAREVIKVATPRTEAKWVEAATNSSRKVLAAKVARVRKTAQMRRRNPTQSELLPVVANEESLVGEVPVRVSLEMSPEQFARYEALWEKLHKLGGVPAGAGKVEVLLEALAGRVIELGQKTSSAVTGDHDIAYAKPAPRGATPFTIHIHQCPDCEQATVQTSAGEKSISHTELGRIQCDAVITRPGHQARSTIPPKTRREVLQRDRHRCQGPGCTHTRFLEIHHKRPVAKGGNNEASNLITLCGGCHRLVHANRISPTESSAPGCCN